MLTEIYIKYEMSSSYLYRLEQVLNLSTEFSRAQKRKNTLNIVPLFQ